VQDLEYASKNSKRKLSVGFDRLFTTLLVQVMIRIADGLQGLEAECLRAVGCGEKPSIRAFLATCEIQPLAKLVEEKHIQRQVTNDDKTIQVAFIMPSPYIFEVGPNAPADVI
jgi:hypothetical protein